MAMNRYRRSNSQLRMLLAKAGWTGQEFANAVNRAAAEAGVRLHYDRTSVAHWLAGVRPRPPVPQLIAEALTRGLGRPVTVAEAGLDPPPPARNGALNTDPAAELTRLVGQQTEADTVAYRLRALDVPGWPPPLPPRRRAARETTTPMDAGVLGTAEAMARVFSASDKAFGGGSTRLALAGYLACDIAPRLLIPSRPSVRTRLYKVAGQLAYLCGFMCFDDELHGFGEHYYLTALSLAAEAGDQICYAITLREMSVQAQTLGHCSQAVHLAEAAVTTGKIADPLRRAFLYGRLATAYAACRDPVRAIANLTAAERGLDRASSGPPLIGNYHLASLAHQEAEVRTLLGDAAGAADALVRSLRCRPVTERRARALTLAQLAELQLSYGHLDEALRTWHLFLCDYPHLMSRRADKALANMRAMLRPHARLPAVKALLSHAGASVGTGTGNSA